MKRTTIEYQTRMTVERIAAVILEDFDDARYRFDNATNLLPRYELEPLRESFVSSARRAMEHEPHDRDALTEMMLTAETVMHTAAALRCMADALRPEEPAQ